MSVPRRIFLTVQPRVPGIVVGSGPMTATRSGRNYTIGFDGSLLATLATPTDAKVLVIDPPGNALSLADIDEFAGRVQNLALADLVEAQADITALETGKADLADLVEAQADIATLATGIAALATGKAEAVHTHALSNLTQSAANTGQVVQWNGTEWAPASLTDKVIGSARAEYAAATGLTTQIPTDDTIPQITEGTQILSIDYAASSPISRVRLTFNGFCSAGATTAAVAAIFRSDNVNAINAVAEDIDGANWRRGIAVTAETVPGTTSSLTYSVRVGSSSANPIYMNSTGSARIFGGSARATLILEEFIP